MCGLSVGVRGWAGWKVMPSSRHEDRKFWEMNAFP